MCIWSLLRDICATSDISETILRGISGLRWSVIGKVDYGLSLGMTVLCLGGSKE